MQNGPCTLDVQSNKNLDVAWASFLRNVPFFKTQKIRAEIRFGISKTVQRYGAHFQNKHFANKNLTFEDQKIPTKSFTLRMCQCERG